MAIRPIELPGWMGTTESLDDLSARDLLGANDSGLGLRDSRDLSLYVVTCPGSNKSQIFVRDNGMNYVVDSANSRFFANSVGTASIYLQIPLSLKRRGFQDASDDLILEECALLEDLGYSINLRDQKMPVTQKERWWWMPNN